MAVLGPVSIGEKFAAQCSPVFNTNYDTCGTVTRATINHLNLSQLNALFAPGGLWADLDAWFLHSIEMKACGVQRNTLYDWIMANADRDRMRAAVSGTKVAMGDSLLHPFIMAKQTSVVNRGHYKLVRGWETGDYTGEGSGTTGGPLTDAQIALTSLTTGGTGANKRIIRVEPRHEIPADANWFRVRDIIHIFTRASGVLEHGTWRTIAAAAAADLTYIDVLIASENEGSEEPYSAEPGEGGTIPGYIIPGLNNVNDFEQWCQNLPTIDNRKRVPFWIQTTRLARCIDSEYRKVYARLYDSNPAFREFGDLPLAERNRQDEAEHQMRFVNDFFYNKPISVLQGLTTWQDLDSISTVETAGMITGLGGKLIGKRANFVGVREQLRICDRVKDVQNNPLNFAEFLRLNYDIYRARKSRGRNVTRIDWWTSTHYRAILFDAFLAHYKAMYGGADTFRVTFDLNCRRDNLNENLGVTFDTYRVKWPSGIEIAILSDDYFDDRRNEFDQTMSHETSGNLLLSLDIGKPGPSGGTIYWAQIASKRKVHTTASLDQLAKLDSTYRCVMEAISIEQTLKSDTGTAVVECPLESAWIENFTDGPPTQTASNPTANAAGYGNLY